MRKLILLFCLTIITPSMDLIEFKKSILESNSNIDTIEVSQLKNDTSFFFVNIVEEKKHWESLILVKLTDENVIIIDSNLTDGQYIHSINDTLLDNKVHLEVFGSTYKGNGSFSLYRLENDYLVTLIDNTYAKDCHHDWFQQPNNYNTEYSKILKNCVLEPSYEDLNGDGNFDVILYGLYYILGEREQIIDSIPAQKIFLFSNSDMKFKEEKSKRLGFEDWQD